MRMGLLTYSKAPSKIETEGGHHKDHITCCGKVWLISKVGRKRDEL
jgi:hypothetical protein